MRLHGSTLVPSLAGLFLMALVPGCGDDAPPGKDVDTVIVTVDPDCTSVESGFGETGETSLRIILFASGLEAPWGLDFIPGTGGEDTVSSILVTERPGRVRVVEAGIAQPPIANFEIANTQTGGALGLALHPEFTLNRFFYVYVTDGSDGAKNRVVRWRLSEDLLSAELDRVIVDDIPAGDINNGGRLRFGPDGMLYIATGDAGEPSRAQSTDSLGGKILRVTPEGDIPADNPFSASPVYVLGMRNPQAMTFVDAGTLMIADEGPAGDPRGSRNSISIVKPGDNMGWPHTLGCETAQNFVSPVITWAQQTTPGGASLFQSAVPTEWTDEGYLNIAVGMLDGEHLSRIALNASSFKPIAFQEVYLEGQPPLGLGRLRELVQGPDGNLWAMTSNCDEAGICAEDKDRIVRLEVPEIQMGTP